MKVRTCSESMSAISGHGETRVRFPAGECKIFGKTLVFFLNLPFQIYSKSKVTILAVTTSNPRKYSGEYPRLSRGRPAFDSPPGSARYSEKL